MIVGLLVSRFCQKRALLTYLPKEFSSIILTAVYIPSQTNIDAVVIQVFKEAATDIREYTDTVCDYITFCEGLCIPKKPITSYPNDKPWFNTYIKQKLQAKQDAYKGNDKAKYKKTRYAAEKAVKTGKAKYRDKLEEKPSP